MALTVGGTNWLGRLIDTLLPPSENSESLPAFTWTAEIALAAVCLGVILRGRRPVKLGGGGRGIGLLGRHPIGLSRSSVLQGARRMLGMAEEAGPSKPKSPHVAKTVKWRRDGWDQDLSRSSWRSGRRR